MQLHALNRSVLQDAAFRQAMTTTGLRREALEHHVDAVMMRFHDERARLARSAGAFTRWRASFDAAARTGAVEHMDAPDYPERGKLAIAMGLHAMNVVSTAYRRFFALLAPTLREIERRHGRPARVLELASGSGGFAFALASLAARSGMHVDVEASDVVPLYVARGQEKARARASSRGAITFRLLDALDTDGVDDHAYDLVFIAQSCHHFSPGKLARMIAEARRIGTTAFVSVDGHRGLSTLAFVSVTSILTLWPAMIHDGILSARKFYGAEELEAIAAMAAPDADIHTKTMWPFTALTVRFNGSGGR